MDPRKRLQVLQQNSPSIRTVVAPKQNLTVDTGKGVYDVASNATAGAKDSAPHVSKPVAIASGVAHGISQSLHDTTDILPQTVGQLKAITPRAFDGFADKARSLAQTVSDTASGYNKVNSLLEENGNLNVRGDINNPLGQNIATGSRIGANVLQAAPAAAGLAYGGYKAVKNAPTAFNSAKSVVGALKTGGLTAAKNQASVNKSVKVANKLGVNADLLHSLKTDNDVSSIVAKLIDAGIDQTQDVVGIATKIANTKSAKEVGKALVDLPAEGAAASAIAAATSDGIAREKYGVSPLTGEKAPVTTRPVPNDAPSTITPGQPNELKLQSTKFEDMQKEAEDLGIAGAKAVDAPTTDFKTKVNSQVGKTEILPSNAKAISSYNTPKLVTEYKVGEKVSNATAQGGTIDGVIVKTPDFSKDLRFKGNNFTIKLDDGTTIKTDGAGFGAPSTPQAKSAVPTPEQAVGDVSKAQTGSVAAEVAQDGSTAVNDAKTADKASQVAQDVNKNADEAAERTVVDGAGNKITETQLIDRFNELSSIPKAERSASQATQLDMTKNLMKKLSSSPAEAPSLDGKTIRYSDAETGKTKIATVADLRRDIKEFKEKYGTEDLTAARQKKLEELERNYHVATFDAEKMMPGATQQERAAVQKIVDGLSENLKNYDTAAKLRAKDKAVRFAKGTKASEGVGGGLDGYKAQLSSLKGKYGTPKFNAVETDTKSRDSILDLIESNGKSRGWQEGKRLNTKTAILKVLGEVDGAPTPSEIRNIREFFGDEVADVVQEVVDKHPQDWKSVVTGIAGLPKSLMSTFDFSAPRQAGQLGAAHPIQFVKSYARSIKAAFNEDYFNKSYVEKWRNDPDFDLITENMGVDIPGVTNANEERYANANIAEKIPGYGKTVIKGSERAYNYLLGDLRANVAKKVINNAGGQEGYKAAMASNYGENADKASRIWGETINTLSGRGGARGGLLEKHMASAGATLFSPRLWASKVQQLNPVWYAKLLKNNPAAAKEALKAQAMFYTMVGTTLALAAAHPDVEVGTDMRSADFGKIKIGNTRMDIMGGEAQNLVQAWRQISGEKVNSETGEVSKLGEGYGSKNRFDLFVDMLISKSNPLINTAVQIAKSTDNPDSKNPLERLNQYGDKSNIGGDIAGLAVPLNIQGVADTTKDTGSLAKGLAFNAPGVVGVGVNTYGTTPTKDKGKPKSDGIPSFKGKVTPDMVTDNGRVLQDAKGKPVTVKIPDGASKAEIQALKDQKKESALKDEYKRSLSSEDQALLKRSKNELKKYVTDGTITQAKYDSLQEKQNKLDTIGKADDAESTKVPDGVTDANDITFYKKLKSLTKEQQAEFTKHGKSDPEAKAIVDELNNNPNNPGGVPKLGKANNQLAKLYVDYKADLNKNKSNDTIFDRQNKAKKFWTEAIKTQYDSVAQDMVAEGNSKDYKALLHAGQITKDQLKQAIELDNALYQTGFVGLKFSKKFRDEYGFATPSKTADGKSLGNGSGSSKKASVNAHLDALLPGSMGGSSSAKAPNFSAKSRGIKFKGTSTNYKPGATKKISINL